MHPMREFILDDDFWDEVLADSEARKADPLPFAAEVLERLFLHESDKERGFVRWDDAMQQGIWWADDALVCLQAVLTSPPAELGTWVREHAGILWQGETPASPAAHVAWLEAVVARLRSAFDAYVARARAER